MSQFGVMSQFGGEEETLDQHWGYFECGDIQNSHRAVSHFLTLTYEMQLSKAQTAANGSDAGWQKD